MNINVVLHGGLGNRLFMLASCYGLSKLTRRKMNVLGSKPNHEHAEGQDNGTFMFLFDNLCALDIACDRFVGENREAHETTSHFHEGMYEFMTDLSTEIFGTSQNNPSQDLRLHGYLQNENYFAQHRPQLQYMFRLPEFVKNRGPRPSQGTVAVHVRLGDYKHKSAHFIDLTGYYERAIALARDKIADVTFVIVCEEPDLLSSFYPSLLGQPDTSVLPKLDELDTFHFMTLCSGVITANSTFSWWAAFLNETPAPEKFITVPSKFINYQPVQRTLDMSSQGGIIVPI